MIKLESTVTPSPEQWKMSDLVIIKCKTATKPKDFEKAYSAFLKQKACGLILLPPIYDVIVAPGDVDVCLTDAKVVPETLDLSRRWIPCSERLPEEKGQYLVTRDVDFNYPSLATFNPYNDHWYTLSGFASISKVIAWMPLPDIYKGE